MSRETWLRLPGTRYRCTPLYLPLDDLDPLARLFLEVLQFEHSVPRLLKAFHLTERVVEDVIGDLIRRNRVRLLLHGGVKELRLVDANLPNPVREPGDSFDVWQDHATGIVLPAELVDPYQQAHGSDPRFAAPLVIDGVAPIVEDFLSASDAQLIDMLLRSDDNLRARDEGLLMLDRLAERHRVRPQAVWLRVEEANIQGRIIPLLATDSIPPWVARVWSVGLRRASLVAPSDLIGFHAAATTWDEGRRLVHGWRAITRVDLWRDAIEVFFRQMPPPISGYDLRRVREAQASLAGVLLGVAQIELMSGRAPEGSLDWLAGVLDDAREWAVVLLSLDEGEALAEHMAGRAMSESGLPNNLYVVVQGGTPGRCAQLQVRLKQALGLTRTASVLLRGWPEDGPVMALSDRGCVQLRWGATGPTLRLRGYIIASEMLGVIQALPSPNAAVREHDVDVSVGELLRRLRVRPDDPPAPSQGSVGAGVDARPVLMVVDKLRAYGDMLLQAIVDPLLLLSPGGEPSVAIDRDRPIAEQVPQLVVECDVLSHYLSLAPGPPWALWSRLASHELIATVAAVLTEPQRREVEGHLLVLTSALADLGNAALLDLLWAAVIEHGWSVTLAVGARGKQRAREIDVGLATLRERIPSARLEVVHLVGPVPAHALVLGDLVFLAGGDWLSTVIEAPIGLPDFGLAVDSRELADNLLAYVRNNGAATR